MSRRSKCITLNFKHLPAGTGLAFVRGMAGLPLDPTTTTQADAAARAVASGIVAVNFTSSFVFAVAGTADAVRAGTKTVTRRLAKEGKSCRWREGALARAYERDPRTGAKPFGAVRILSVRRERLVEITDAEVKLEGTEATTRRGFVRLFAELHSIDAARIDEVFVWRVGFRLVAADETPPFGGVR